MGEELDYIAGLYPFGFKPGYHVSLLYASGLLSLCRKGLSVKKGSRGSKILNLAAGIELLGMGCDFHNFDITEGSKNILGRGQAKYTRDLLFGDVLYSRSVNYLLSFEDMLVFEEVINSLKSVHAARLAVYQDLLRVVDRKLSLDSFLEDRMGLLLGINSLYKNSFLIGYSIFPLPWPRDLAGNISYIYRFVNHITLLKSFGEIREWLKINHYPELEVLWDKLNHIKKQLDEIICQLEIDWLQLSLEKQVDHLWGRVLK